MEFGVPEVTNRKYALNFYSEFRISNLKKIQNKHVRVELLLLSIVSEIQNRPDCLIIFRGIFFFGAQSGVRQKKT